MATLLEMIVAGGGCGGGWNGIGSLPFERRMFETIRLVPRLAYVERRVALGIAIHKWLRMGCGRSDGGGTGRGAVGGRDTRGISRPKCSRCVC